VEPTLRLMIVDDELIVRESLLYWFRKYGHEIDTAASGPEALEKMEHKPFHLLFVDIKMPGMDGLELLERVKKEYPDTLVVIITAHGSIESAARAMRAGASDYLLKPFKPDQLSLVMEKILNQQKITSDYHYVKGCLDQITQFDNIIGQSPAMEKLYALILEVAQSDASILITGETGTGKELVAKAIHAKSLRAQLPFVAINCGALPDALMESELFGHKKGAFTGAEHSRRGFLEVVSGGTLFLDEIGDISAKMQVDLLRVLDDKKCSASAAKPPSRSILGLFPLRGRTLKRVFRRDRSGKTSITVSMSSRFTCLRCANEKAIFPFLSIISWKSTAMKPPNMWTG
jgi:DNA-binding NtrC family response regulator